MSVKKFVSVTLVIFLAVGFFSIGDHRGLHAYATEVLVENFENYGTDTTSPINGISVGGGASVYLNTDAFSGNYCCKMTYDGSGYGEMYRNNLNSDISSLDMLRMYVKSSISSGTELYIYLITSDAEQWRATVWLDDISYFRFDILLADFINTDGITGYYDTSIHDTTIVGYRFYIKGSSRDIYFDDIQFTVRDQLDDNIIDNFENYGASLTRTFLPGFNKGGGTTSFSLDTNTIAGDFCSKIVFDSTYYSWAEISRDNINKCVDGYDTFNLCVKPGIINFDLMLLITTADSRQWYKLLWMTSTEWTLIQIKLTEFKDFATGTISYDPEVYSNVISSYNVSFAGTSQTLRLDEIKLTRESGITNKTIDNFENRGNDTTITVPGFSTGGGTTSFTLDTLSYEGKYAGKIVFDSSFASWAEISRNNVNINVSKVMPRFRMYSKASSAGFDILVKFRTDQNETFQKLFWKNSTDYAVIECPLSDFVKVGEPSVYYDPSVNSTVIDYYNISFAGSSKTVWIDDIEFDWQQEEFILSAFHPVVESRNALRYERILTNLKNAGLNLVEMTLIDRKSMERALKASEVASISCLVGDLNYFSGMGGSSPGHSVTLETAKRDIVILNQYDNLFGYYLWDEPYTNKFSELSLNQGYFMKHASEKLIFSCLLPSYGPYKWSGTTPSYQSYVDSYISTVNPSVLSLNYYTFGDDHVGNPSLITSDLWRDMGYVRQKALAARKPFWFYFQGLGDLNGALGNMTIEKIRVQMYAGLAYGVKGLSYFTALNLFTDQWGNTLSLYENLKSLNTQVKNLGNYLLDKTSEKIYHPNLSSPYRTAYFLDDLASSTLIDSAPDSIIIGQFADGTSKKYLLVVNKDYTTTKSGTITLKSYKKVSVFNKTDATVSLVSNYTNSIPLNIPGGDASLFIIE